MSDVQMHTSTTPMSPQTMALPYPAKTEAEFAHRTVGEVSPEGTKMRIGLCGLGVVGCGTINALGQNRTIKTADGDITLVITQAGSRSGVPRYDIDETYREHIAFTQDVLDIPDQDDVDIVVDVTGGTRSKAVIEKAIRLGKPVVTADKALLAKDGNPLIQLADEHKVLIGFEAGVAGAIPVINHVKNNPPGNTFHSVSGIVNGTSNFILTSMQEDAIDYATALKNAQDKGFAEADPSADVEGRDAANKLAILSAMTLKVPFTDTIFREGISQITPPDIKAAAECGYVIKPLAIACETDRGVYRAVYPALIPKEHRFATVKYEENAVSLKGDLTGELTLCGPGAGAKPTASAVMADISQAAKSIATPHSRAEYSLGFPCSELTDKPVIPPGDLQTEFLLCGEVNRGQGCTLESLSATLEHRGVMVKEVVQIQTTSPGEPETVHLLTEKAQESKITSILDDHLPSFRKIRVAPFDLGGD